MKKSFVWLAFPLVTLLILIICISTGSVNIPFETTVKILLGIAGDADKSFQSIILNVRLPRVLAVALTGASLSLCGGTMQGLLRNPMADGSTLGVSSGASLGAVLAILLGLNIPTFAIIFAFLSLLFILLFSYKVDFSLSTNTIILTGIIFSMFASALISLCITFASSRANTITFWTLGSLAGSNYKDVLILFLSFAVCATLVLLRSNELNAFSLGEENAYNLGINIKRVKLELLICVSILTGICVSVGGTIAFVGLITPHMARFIVGPNHKKMLPATIFTGTNLLLIADLIARTIAKPQEMPIGVITSIFGAIVFVVIMAKKGRN